MSLLREIQAAILDPNSDIAPILLKLRFLASRLGSDVLEEWVKYEADGYPPNVALPEYRKIGVTFTGCWSGPFGSGVENAPIPPYLIEQFASKSWNVNEMRQSIATVDNLINSSDKTGNGLRINASNLILLLQGNVYPELTCISVTGYISTTAVMEIQNTVRNRVLELTLELEKTVPMAVDVTLDKALDAGTAGAEKVTQIVNQTIYGNYTGVTNAGDSARITFAIAKGDEEAMIGELVKAGIKQEDAEEFAGIVASETSKDPERPFGTRAGKWLAQNIGKAVNGTWKVGAAVATKILEEATLQYYGLK